MDLSDARKLKALEDENRKLKKLLAESALDAATLRCCRHAPDQPCHQVGQSRSYPRRQPGPGWRIADSLRGSPANRPICRGLLPRADIGFV
jgi:putative transposase